MSATQTPDASSAPTGLAGRIIDMYPFTRGIGNYVISATKGISATRGNDVGLVLLVTTPAPRVGDTLSYYTDDAEVLDVKPSGDRRDAYFITVRAIAPNVRDDRAAASAAPSQSTCWADPSIGAQP